MPQNQLGLFDTPPDRRQSLIGLAIVCLLCASLPVIYPVRSVLWPRVDAFIPVVDSIMVLGEAITATLLYSQARVFRSRALVALASGYIFTALLLIPHVLSFPGAFAPDGLLGAGVNTTGWLAYSRRWAFPVMIIVYVWLRQREFAAQPGTERPPVHAVAWGLGAVTAAGAVTLLTTVGHDLLPPYFASPVSVADQYFPWYQLLQLVGVGVAGTMLIRTRTSVLDMWLLVATASWLIETLMIATLTHRFSAGWYWVNCVTLFSHLVVMLALIAESNRLHARLALATLARNRERSARLMSLDAVAAAISHEVAQPLTAIRLHAGTGRNLLAATPPDVPGAIKSLDAIFEAEHRTSAVIKSVRAMFAQRREGRTEFNLNDLVRKTVLMMDWELLSHRVSLDLALDDALPPVLADPVQIQRVLVNLVTNAIEALDATESRPRTITIRSKAPEGQAVLLEVSDNGPGIAPDAIEQVFEVYFTTKETGVGLGLSLCRIIVEASGGRLWASRGEPYGVTLHLELPRSDLFAG